MGEEEMIYVFRDWPTLPVKVFVKRFSDEGGYHFIITDRVAFGVWMTDKFDWRKHK